MKRLVVIQTVFWTILIGINLGFGASILPFPKMLIPAFTTALFTIIILYGNSLYLFPKYFNSNNNTKFYILSVGMVGIVGAVYGFTDIYFLKDVEFNSPKFIRFPHAPMIAKSIFWLSLVHLISTVYMLQEQIQRNTEETRIMSEEKLSTELKFLKAQINPHFLFNALNNIYSLAYLKSDRAPEGILRLSNMLRYVLDDCQADHVPINSEIQYIENFIDFQQMKSPQPQNIRFTHNTIESKLMLAPMLLIPFIENSFKYSKVESIENSYVVIELEAINNSLYFNIRNSFPEKSKVESGSGKGIENVKHRLNILYPEKHELTIAVRQNEFAVTLNINCL
jgi:sensor histidine kinase YesM